MQLVALSPQTSNLAEECGASEAGSDRLLVRQQRKRLAVPLSRRLLHRPMTQFQYMANISVCQLAERTESRIEGAGPRIRFVELQQTSDEVIVNPVGGSG